jgi:hypothetical protein
LEPRARSGPGLIIFAIQWLLSRFAKDFLVFAF